MGVQHLMAAAMPYGDRYVAMLQRKGEFVSSPARSARQFAEALAQSASMKRISVEEVVSRLWPELIIVERTVKTPGSFEIVTGKRGEKLVHQYRRAA